MSEDYNNLFLSNYKSFKENISRSDFQYTLFYPQIGKDYHLEKHLLIIGRAPNGWGVFWNPSDDVDQKFKESMEFSTTFDSNEKCQLEWINTDWNNKSKSYNLYRSKFWNVVYKLVLHHLKQNDSNWHNIIAWSNLMKISPKAGWNPSDKEYYWQLPNSIKLIQREIEELSPKVALLITGLEWCKDFFKNYQEAEIHIKFYNNSVKKVYHYKSSKIIIAERPECRKQNIYLDEIYLHLNLQ